MALVAAVVTSTGHEFGLEIGVLLARCRTVTQNWIPFLSKDKHIHPMTNQFVAVAASLAARASRDSSSILRMVSTALVS
jgi:hypothetical protein